VTAPTLLFNTTHLRILVYFSLYPPSGIIFNSIHNYLEIMFPIDVLRFSEFRTMRNHLSETLMLNDIQITSDYISRWVVLKRGVGAFTIQGVLKVLFSPYFKNQSVPIVSYSYTNSIGRKIFKYKEALQDINIEEYLKNPLTCDCSHSFIHLLA
jgi:hypothetical protein